MMKKRKDTRIREYSQVNRRFCVDEQANGVSLRLSTIEARGTDYYATIISPRACDARNEFFDAGDAIEDILYPRN